MRHLKALAKFFKISINIDPIRQERHFLSSSSSLRPTYSIESAPSRKVAPSKQRLLVSIHTGSLKVRQIQTLRNTTMEMKRWRKEKKSMMSRCQLLPCLICLQLHQRSKPKLTRWSLIWTRRWFITSMSTPIQRSKQRGREPRTWPSPAAIYLRGRTRPINQPIPSSRAKMSLEAIFWLDREQENFLRRWASIMKLSYLRPRCKITPIGYLTFWTPASGFRTGPTVSMRLVRIPSSSRISHSSEET